MLAPFTGHPYDLRIWMETGQYVAQGKSPYAPNPHIGYPPLWALWCGLSFLLSSFILPGNLFAYIFAIKIPIIAGDIAITLVLLSFSRSNGSASGRKLASIFLLNPYVLAVGVVWGMMDNLVALLVCLAAIEISRRVETLAGVFFGLAIALKLYPLLFLPVALLGLAKDGGSRERVVKFLLALSATTFFTITAPFIVFGWSTTGLLSVAASQTTRQPGGVSPIGVLAFLANYGINKVGPYYVSTLSQNIFLRFIWVPTILLGVFLLRRKFAATNVMMSFCFTYLIWILTAPWVSEPNVETLLILMLLGTYACTGKIPWRSSLGLSILVLAFLSLNVPITSFAFPVSDISVVPLANIGARVIPWISLTFAIYATFQAMKTTKMILRSR